MSRFVLSGLAACGLVFLTACSSDMKTATSDAKATAEAPAAAAGPVSGKTAYWEMYTEARKWATDLMPLSLEAKEIPGIANEDGKAAMWNATFVSASQKEMRVFTYAIVAHPPDIYKGVTIGKPLPWNGARDVMPFSMSQVQIDSDAAIKSAGVEAAAWLKQHPEKNPTINLKELARYQLPTWIVMWGNDKVGYRSFVSGVDGKPITGK
jgi:hypothetical protein